MYIDATIGEHYCTSVSPGAGTSSSSTPARRTAILLVTVRLGTTTPAMSRLLSNLNKFF